MITSPATFGKAPPDHGLLRLRAAPPHPDAGMGGPTGPPAPGAARPLDRDGACLVVAENGLVPAGPHGSPDTSVLAAVFPCWITG